MNRITGVYLTITTMNEPVQAFIPHPLPPNEPKLAEAFLVESQAAAVVALNRLSAVAGLVPSVDGGFTVRSEKKLC